MTQEEKSTEETKIEETETETKQPEKLSIRDALEVAIEAHKDKPDREEIAKNAVEHAARSSDNDAQRREKPSSKPNLSPLQAPGEWTPEEKADFAELTPKQQEAHLRLYQTRAKTLSELRALGEANKAAANEAKWAKDLAEKMTPILKARGDKDPFKTISDAVELVGQVDKDHLSSVAAILAARGEKELAEMVANKAKNSGGLPAPEITALQTQVKELSSKISQKESEERTAMIGNAWRSFETLKNASGLPKYPDINASESGLKMSRDIGSLVYDDTPLARDFITRVRARNPNATYETLLEEAYKYLGGRIDNSETPARTQDTQKHVVKSSRAASSVPGKSSHSANGHGAVKLPLREALAKALAETKDIEG